MSFTLVQSRATHFTAASPNSDQYASNVTAGNLLACAIHTYCYGLASISVSDDVNGAWTAGPALFCSGNFDKLFFFYCANTAGGSMPTVTVTIPQAGEIRLSIAEFASVATASVDAGSASAAGNGTAPTVDVTTSEANTLLVEVFGHSGSARTLTEGSGYTLIQEDESGGVPFCWAYKTAASAGSNTCDGTIGTGAVNWVMLGQAFKAASSPAPASSSLLGLMGIGA